MKKSPLVNSIAYFFILLFLYTAIAKLMEYRLFKEQLISSPMIAPLAGLLTWALPAGEIIIAVLLFIPHLRLKGLYLSAILMTFFTCYVTALLFIDSHLSCSCGGVIEELSPKQHLLFNIACVVLGIIGILIARRREPTPRFKWLAFSTTLALFLIVGLTLFAAFTTPPTLKTGMEGRLLPSFKLLLPDSSTVLNTKDIPSGKPFIIIGYSPFCVHCQALTNDIVTHIDSFGSVHIYFVTNFPFKDLREFNKVFQLDRYPNITMTWDEKEYYLSYFKATGVPLVIVFDSQKRVKRVMSTHFNASELAKIALE